MWRAPVSCPAKPTYFRIHRGGVRHGFPCPRVAAAIRVLPTRFVRFFSFLRCSSRGAHVTRHNIAGARVARIYRRAAGGRRSSCIPRTRSVVPTSMVEFRNKTKFCFSEPTLPAFVRFLTLQYRVYRAFCVRDYHAASARPPQSAGSARDPRTSFYNFIVSRT